MATLTDIVREATNGSAQPLASQFEYPSDLRPRNKTSDAEMPNAEMPNGHSTRVARIASVLVIAIGCLVLLGWTLDVAVLKSVNPSMVSMKPNTALGFLLAGAACLMATVRRPTSRHCIGKNAMALAVVALGVLTTIEWMFGLDLGIDQVLFHDDPAAVGTIFPGRMAPWTALNFTIYGMAMLLIDLRSAMGRSVVQSFALLGCLPAALSLLGYLFGAPELFGAGLRPHIALHTNLAFVLLAAGVLAERWERDDALQVVKDFGIAVLTATLALLTRWIFWPLLDTDISYLVLWPAVILSAWHGGFRAGFLATLLCAIGTTYFLLEPRFSLAIDSPAEQFGIAIFLFLGAAQSLLLDKARKSERKRILAEAEILAFQAASSYLRSLIEASLDPLVTIGPDGKIKDVNTATEAATGRPRTELIGTDFDNYFTDPDRARASYELVFRTGSVRDYALEIRHADGHRTPVLYNAAVYRDQQGKVLGLFAAARDITERKRMEEALAQRAEDLERAGAYNRSLIEASLDPLVTIGPDGKITDVNAATEAATGKTRAELIGTDFDAYFTEPDRARAGYEQVFRTGSVRDYALEIRHADGHQTPVHYNATVYRDQQGKVVGVFAAARDISERKRAESNEAEVRKIAWLLGNRSESLKPREIPHQPYGDLVQLNTSRLIADGVDEGTLKHLTDINMDLLESSSAVYERNGDYALGIFSSGWCRFLDQASRNLCATSDNREALASGKWLCHESCWECSRKSIESGQPVDMECKGGIRLYGVPVRRGNEIVGSMNFGYGDPPKDPQKLAELAARYHVSVEELSKAASEYESRPTYLVNLAKERLKSSAALVGAILEAKQAKVMADELNRSLERRIQERTAELATSNKELEAFAYSVSHDLRSPLRAIDGFSQILLKEYFEILPEKPRHFLQVVCDNARQMGRLIDDLLRFSRSSRQSLELQAIAPEGLVRQCLEELQSEHQGRHIEFRIDDLPVCWGDRSLLKQIWFNLLSNALKFTRKRDPARITIGIQRQNGETVYYIRDNGVGFDMQYANKLFGVFQRLHSAEEYEGTGIGLALVQRIIHRHGGRIWAEGKYDEGATFYFTLPHKTP